MPRSVCLAMLALLLGIPAAAGAGWGERVAQSARWCRDQRPALRQNDCSGLVERILSRAGHAVEGNALSFWKDAVREGRVVERARPGDLVFFDYTYDRNRNGKVDDRLTHIAVVVSVDGDGTAHMVHKGSKGIRPLRLNAVARSAHKRRGKVVNDFLRKPGYGPRNGARLAGELLRGYARPPGPRASKTSTRPTRKRTPQKSQKRHTRRSVFD